jgi:hypothetical protein
MYQVVYIKYLPIFVCQLYLNKMFLKEIWPGVVECAYNPSIQDYILAGRREQGQPGIHSENVSQKARTEDIVQ